MTGMYGNSAARDVQAELLKERNQCACQLIGFGGKKSCSGMCEDNGMIYVRHKFLCTSLCWL